MGSNLQIIINGVDQASDTFGDVGNAMDSLTGKAGGLLSKGLGPLQSMLGTGLKVAAGVAATAVGGLAAGLASSVSDAADFQQGMADIQASMGASTEETAQLKNLILDLGIDPKLKVSAEEAAQAIGQLGTAGVSIDDIMNGAARSTVLLANATGADFADAASMASDVSKLWAIDAGDLTHAVNGITAATVASKFNINDYKLALSQAGGVASTVGVSFDDFNATIAAISPSFASGSDAGTSFKVFLQRLIPQSNTARDAMRDLGLFTGSTKQEFQDAQAKIEKLQMRLSELNPTSKNYATTAAKLNSEIAALRQVTDDGSNAFFDANGNMKSMAEITGILNKAFVGLTEEQKNQYLSTIFGTDAMRAAAAMAKMTTSDFNSLAETMGKTDAAQSAAVRMDTLKGSLEILSGTFDTLKLMVGDKFLPVLNDLVKRFNDFLGAQAPMIVDWAGQLATKLGDLATTWLPALVSGFKIGIDIVGALIGRFEAIVKEVSWLAQVFAQSGFDGLFTVFEDGSSHVDGLLESFGVAESAAMALGSVLAHLGQILVDLGRYLTFTITEGDYLNDWLSHLPSFLRPAVLAIGTIIGVLSETAQEIAAWVNGNQSGFDTVQHIWNDVARAGEILFGRLIDFVKSNLPAWLATLQDWGAAAWQWIKDATPVALGALGEWGSALWGWIASNAARWTANLLTWGTAMWQWIGDNIPKAIDKLTEWVKNMGTWTAGQGNSQLLSMFGTMGSTMLSALGKIGLSLLELAGTVIGKLVQLFVDNLPAIVAKLSEWAGALWGWIQTNWPTWKAKLMEWGAALWQWIVEVTPIVLAKLGEWAVALWGWFTSNLPGWLAKLGEWAGALWRWIVDVTPTVLAKLGEWLGKLGQWLIDNLPTWIGKLASWAGALWGWIVDAWPDTLSKLTEWGGKLWGWFTDGKPGWGSKLSGWASDIMGQLGSGFTSAKDAVGDTLKSALNEVQTKGLGFATGEMLGKMYEGGRSFITQMSAGINAAAPNLRTDLSNAFAGVTAAWNYAHDTLLPHFASSAKDLMASATTAFASSDFGQAMNTAFIALRDKFNYWHDDLFPHFFAMAGTLGKALIDGLSGAIKNGAKDAIAAIQGATDALPQWVKDKLGIHSPSTVFAGLGQNIMQGLVEGMQSMAGAPQAVLSDMTAGMMTGAAGGTVTTNNTTSTTNNWNVTIPTAGGNQPVDQMQSMFNTLTTIYAG